MNKEGRKQSFQWAYCIDTSESTETKFLAFLLFYWSSSSFTDYCLVYIHIAEPNAPYEIALKISVIVKGVNYGTNPHSIVAMNINHVSEFLLL